MAGSTGKLLRREVTEIVFTVSNIRAVLQHGAGHLELQRLGAEVRRGRMGRSLPPSPPLRSHAASTGRILPRGHLARGGRGDPVDDTATGKADASAARAPPASAASMAATSPAGRRPCSCCPSASAHPRAAPLPAPAGCRPWRREREREG
uniref:Uncharacterized protein n=1 Tax=Oryza rufipogon TaxID=4529 RepID=A0A0E0NFU6_ORYRU